jgi:exodeoxyribonuclease VII large subunit
MRLRNTLSVLGRGLRMDASVGLRTRRFKVDELARALNAVSPLATLHRGYAILMDRDGARVVRSATQAEDVRRFVARLSDGEIPLRRDEE